MGSVVGLYIQPEWVEAVELRTGLASAGVVRFGRFPLLSHDALKLTEGITGALEAANIRARDAIIAIPSQEIFLRYFLLPSMPKSEWNGAVKFEARKYVPFKMEELVWDSCLIEQPATRQLGVVFVGVRKEVLTQYVTCVRNAGLRPVAIEAASFSLARAMQYGRPREDMPQITIGVDISSDAAHVAFVKTGLPLLARDVSLASPTEARSVETLVRSQAAADQPAAEQTASKQRMEHLISELHLSIDYFSREFPNDQIREILLYGERLDGGWVEALGREFHVPVAVGRIAATLRGAAPLVSGWTVAVGLGLRALRSRVPRINLLQMDAAPVAAKTPPQQTLWWSLAEAAVAGLALMVVHGGFTLQIRQAQERLATVQEEAVRLRLPYPNATLKELTAVRDGVDKQIALLRQVIRDRVPITPKLASLARLMPENVWLDRLIYRVTGGAGPAAQRALTLQGFCYRGSAADELETISQLVQQLRGDAAIANTFPRTELGAVTRVAQQQRFTVTSFELQCSSTGDGHGTL